jgi:hypothetical protein
MPSEVPTASPSSAPSDFPTLANFEYYFDNGDWSQCTNSCGGGTQNRTVACMASLNHAHAVEVDATECNTEANLRTPSSWRPCNMLPCETYHWETTEWGSCGATCLEANTTEIPERTRIVYCVSDRTGVPVDGANCDPAEEPVRREACTELETCPEFYYEYARFGFCSEACGGGIRTREAYCYEDGVQVNNTVCAAEIGAPADGLVTACNTYDCVLYPWTVGPWTECSAECDGGNQTRFVTCLSSQPLLYPADDDDCDINQRPNEVTECNTEPCDPCEGELCSNHGECALGECVCDTGFAGPFCGVELDQCAGVTDITGGCCLGVLAPDATCCGDDATAIIDRSGACCESGVVDACGICDGDGTIIDIAGQCCSGALDAGGYCCESEEFDQCGLCDGDGTSCMTVVEVPFVGITCDSLDLGQCVTDFAALLSIEAERFFNVTCNMGAIGNDDDGSRRRMQQDGVNVGFSIDQPETITNPEEDIVITPTDVLNAFEDEAAANAGVVSLGGAEVEASELSADVEGDCGNTICEAGELCEDLDDEDCCIDDCPFIFNDCPVPPGSDEYCGGRGDCIFLSGACNCYEDMGYGGEDCSSCNEGFTMVDGECIVVVVQVDCVVTEWVEASHCDFNRTCTQNFTRTIEVEADGIGEACPATFESRDCCEAVDDAASSAAATWIGVGLGCMVIATMIAGACYNMHVVAAKKKDQKKQRDVQQVQVPGVAMTAMTTSGRMEVGLGMAAESPVRMGTRNVGQGPAFSQAATSSPRRLGQQQQEGQGVVAPQGVVVKIGGNPTML